MKDVYVMNKETGEILPSVQVISEYYKEHSYRDAWTDEWEETTLEVENSNYTEHDLVNLFLGAVRV